jgi:multidrug resistance efflux pump
MNQFEIENSVENLILKNRITGSSFYVFILLLALGGISSLPFINVDVSSRAPGFIRPLGDNVPVISLVSGNIQEINLKNNKAVQKGDTLLMINPQSINSQVAVNVDFQNQLQQNMEDLDHMINGESNSYLKLPHNQSELDKYLAQKKELVSRVRATTQIFQRNKELFIDRVIPQSEFEKFEDEKIVAEEALISFEKKQLAQWHQTKKELIEARKNYKGDQRKFEIEKKNYVIISPITGTIINFKGFESQSSVGASTQLAEISPDAPLIVECQVNPKDVGLIKMGQAVRLQMDAFNYNQWGFLDAKVFEIDHHPVINNNAIFFRVKCSLTNHRLVLKNGYSAEVQQGMSLVARFIITKRSLYQLLFDKVDSWLNPSINPA